MHINACTKCTYHTFQARVDRSETLWCCGEELVCRQNHALAGKTPGAQRQLHSSSTVEDPSKTQTSTDEAKAQRRSIRCRESASCRTGRYTKTDLVRPPLSTFSTTATQMSRTEHNQKEIFRDIRRMLTILSTDLGRKETPVPPPFRVCGGNETLQQHPAFWLGVVEVIDL